MWRLSELLSALYQAIQTAQLFMWVNQGKIWVHFWLFLHWVIGNCQTIKRTVFPSHLCACDSTSPVGPRHGEGPSILAARNVHNRQIFDCSSKAMNGGEWFYRSIHEKCPDDDQLYLLQRRHKINHYQHFQEGGFRNFFYRGISRNIPRTA